LSYSPAGSKEAFIAAIEAVYCGLKGFSARSKAQNFTNFEFYKWVSLKTSILLLKK
jgi:collagenase-like PrtC family protease